MKMKKSTLLYKYPNNYSENSYDPNPNTPGSWQIQIMSPLTEDHSGPGLNSRELKMEIYIQSKKVNDSLDAFFEEQAQAEDFDPQWSRSKINIAGIEAIKLNWTGMGSGISYFLINNNKRINIIKYPQNTSLDSEFNQILSTFKVIDPTADWKTYIDKENGFQFNYPLSASLPKISIIDNQNNQLTPKMYSISLTEESNSDELCPGCYKIYNEKDYLVDNKIGLLQEITSHPAGRGLKIIIPHNNKLIILRYGLGDPNIPISSTIQEEFSQILSTFKFTQ